MELIIGRESQKNRLRISVDNQDFFLGDIGSVPQSVSRQHCKLVIKEKGNYVITTIKNMTYVNGTEIESKHISDNDRVELGNDRYYLNIAAILKMVSSASPATYSIQHLQKVWNEFHDTKLRIQIKEKKSAAIRSVTSVFSMSAICCGFIPGIAEYTSLRILLYFVIS